MARRSLLPLRTRRLTIRPLERRDVTRFTGYRNLPEIARFQDWPLPYTRDLAHQLLDDQEGVTGPGTNRWIQLAIDDGAGIVGDLAVWLSADGLLAMVGYTLAPDAQGRGLATEATGALVDALFERAGVHRVAATLDPRNVPSARVLERLGFRHEGRAAAAALVRGAWEDDDRYAVLADEYRAWRDRPLAPPVEVRLVEVTPDDVREAMAIVTHRSQEQFVATVAESFADALVPEVVDGAPLVPWYRVVEADGARVGFVMLAEMTDAHPDPYLWRLLVDRRHQGRGIGRRVIELVVEHVRAAGATRLMTSWVDDRGGPAEFYLRLGFVTTGEVVDDETVGALDLSARD